MVTFKRVVVCGSPRSGSKTLQAAVILEHTLFGDAEGAETIDLSSSDRAAGDLLSAIEQAEAIVVASPVYKGAITGTLKSAFDVMAGGALEGKVCAALMLGANAGHSLAVRYSLVPMLEELGGFVLPSIYVTEAQLAEGGGWAIDYRERLRKVSGTLLAPLFTVP